MTTLANYRSQSKLKQTEIPQTIAFELSSACSFQCSYCDRINWKTTASKRTKQHLSLDVFKTAISEICRLDPVPSVTLNYEGESLLNPQLSEFLEFCGEKKISPWISTSLYPASQHIMKDILEYCSAVSVSLEGNLDNFISVKGPDSVYNSITQNLEYIINLNHNYGKEINVSAVLPRGTSIKSPGILQFIEQWVDRVSNIYLWEGIDFQVGNLMYFNELGISEHLKRRRPCTQPFEYLAVLSDGSLSPCCNTSRVKLKTPTIMDGLINVCEHEEYIVFRQKHLDNDLDGTLCEHCELWIDDWLGDEQTSIQLGDGRILQAYYEGSTIRISGTKMVGN